MAEKRAENNIPEKPEDSLVPADNLVVKNAAELGDTIKAMIAPDTVAPLESALPVPQGNSELPADNIYAGTVTELKDTLQNMGAPDTLSREKNPKPATEDIESETGKGVQETVEDVLISEKEARGILGLPEAAKIAKKKIVKDAYGDRITELRRQYKKGNLDNSHFKEKVDRLQKAQDRLYAIIESRKAAKRTSIEESIKSSKPLDYYSSGEKKESELEKMKEISAEEGGYVEVDQTNEAEIVDPKTQELVDKLFDQIIPPDEGVVKGSEVAPNIATAGGEQVATDENIDNELAALRRTQEELEKLPEIAAAREVNAEKEREELERFRRYVEISVIRLEALCTALVEKKNLKPQDVEGLNHDIAVLRAFDVESFDPGFEVGDIGNFEERWEKIYSYWDKKFDFYNQHLEQPEIPKSGEDLTTVKVPAVFGENGDTFKMDKPIAGDLKTTEKGEKKEGDETEELGPEKKNLGEVLKKEKKENKEEWEARINKLLKRVAGRRTYRFSKDAEGNLVQQYVQLRNFASTIKASKLNETELEFGVFDMDGNPVLNKDGNQKIIKQKIGKIEFREWKKGEPTEDEISVPTIAVGSAKFEDSADSVIVRDEVGNFDERIAREQMSTSGELSLEFNKEGVKPIIAPYSQVVKYVDGNGKTAYAKRTGPRPELQKPDGSKPIAPKDPKNGSEVELDTEDGVKKKGETREAAIKAMRDSLLLMNSRIDAIPAEKRVRIHNPKKKGDTIEIDKTYLTPIYDGIVKNLNDFEEGVLIEGFTETATYQWIYRDINSNLNRLIKFFEPGPPEEFTVQEDLDKNPSANQDNPNQSSELSLDSNNPIPSVESGYFDLSLDSDSGSGSKPSELTSGSFDLAGPFDSAESSADSPKINLAGEDQRHVEKKAKAVNDIDNQLELMLIEINKFTDMFGWPDLRTKYSAIERKIAQFKAEKDKLVEGRLWDEINAEFKELNALKNEVKERALASDRQKARRPKPGALEKSPLASERTSNDAKKAAAANVGKNGDDSNEGEEGDDEQEDEELKSKVARWSRFVWENFKNEAFPEGWTLLGKTEGTKKYEQQQQEEAAEQRKWEKLNTEVETDIGNAGSFPALYEILRNRDEDKARIIKGMRGDLKVENIVKKIEYWRGVVRDTAKGRELPDVEEYFEDINNVLKKDVLINKIESLLVNQQKYENLPTDNSPEEPEVALVDGKGDELGSAVEDEDGGSAKEPEKKPEAKKGVIGWLKDLLGGGEKGVAEKAVRAERETLKSDFTDSDVRDLENKARGLEDSVGSLDYSDPFEIVDNNPDASTQEAGDMVFAERVKGARNFAQLYSAVKSGRGRSVELKNLERQIKNIKKEIEDVLSYNVEELEEHYGKDSGEPIHIVDDIIDNRVNDLHQIIFTRLVKEVAKIDTDYSGNTDAVRKLAREELAKLPDIK